MKRIHLVPIFAALALVITSNFALSEIVVEWKFDEDSPKSGGDYVEVTPSPDISFTNISELMAESMYSPDPTGISDKWVESLRTGFLDVGTGSGKESHLMHGLVSKNPNTEKGQLVPAERGSYTAAFGIKGLGDGLKGGSVYLVVNPKDWQTGTREVFGTGHIGGRLQLVFRNGALVFSTGTSTGSTQASATVTRDWSPDDWYFIGISWSGGIEPLLYVREMSPEGAAASEAAMVGEASGTVPLIENLPEYDPIAIGTVWINTGGPDSRHTYGGANARIAYVGLDRELATAERMEEVFNRLAAQ